MDNRSRTTLTLTPEDRRQLYMLAAVHQRNIRQILLDGVHLQFAALPIEIQTANLNLPLPLAGLHAGTKEQL